MQKTGEVARQIANELMAQGWQVVSETGHGGHKQMALARDHGVKAVRVEITCNGLTLDRVFIVVLWLNVSIMGADGKPHVGRTDIEISCDGTVDEVMQAIGQLLIRALSIYRDVLSGEGAASKEAILGTPTEQTSEDLTMEEEGI